LQNKKKNVAKQCVKWSYLVAKYLNKQLKKSCEVQIKGPTKLK